MAVIVKKGELGKINKYILKEVSVKPVAYKIEDFKENNISKEAKEALNKVFLAIE